MDGAVAGVSKLVTGGGVAVDGESFRVFIDFTISRNGSSDDGCATLGSGSFLIASDFLKLGKGFFGFGAEKKEESDLAVVASFTALWDFDASFFTTDAGFAEDTTAAFFAEAALDVAIDASSSAFRFFARASVDSIQPINPWNEPA